MAKLAKLAEYKNTILERLSENQDLCKALYHHDRAFLEMPEVDPDQLLFEQIYPYAYVPPSSGGTVEIKTYLTLSLTDFNGVGGGLFRAGNLNIGIFAHQELLRTNYGQLRTEFIADQIDTTMNKETNIGIGRLQFAGLSESSLNEVFYGITLRYRPVDFG